MKYYAEKGMWYEGNYYNEGEIVPTDKLIPGVRTPAGLTYMETHKINYPDVNEAMLVKPGDERIPEISIICTLHNQQRFVRTTVNAMLRQTIKFPYEIILCEDNSTDETAERVDGFKEYAKVFHNKFGHKCKNRNFGFEQAKGRHIAFWDGDDTMFPDYLEVLYDALLKNPEANIAYSRFDYPNYGLDKGMLPACNVFEWSDSWIKYRIQVNTHFLAKWELCGYALWDENMEVAEDWDYHLQLWKYGAKGVHVRRKLWQYNVHEGSTTGRGDLNKQLPESYRIIKERYGLPQERVPFTFVSMFSREYPVDRYFENIAKIEMPRDKMHWLIFLDTMDEDLIKKVKAKAAEQENNFASTRIFVTAEKPIHSPEFEERVMRIARNMGVILTNIGQLHGGSDFIFMVEDDTFVKPDAFNKLWRHMQDNPKMAFVQGVEMGRWFDPRLGAGTMTDPEQDVIVKRHPWPQEHGIEKLSVGGWYCWIGRMEALKNMKFRCKPPIWTGPDEFMVYDLTQKGWECIMDWEVPCEHMNTDGTVLIPSMAKGFEFTYTKRGPGYHGKRVELKPGDVQGEVREFGQREEVRA